MAMVGSRPSRRGGGVGGSARGKVYHRRLDSGENSGRESGQLALPTGGGPGRLHSRNTRLRVRDGKGGTIVTGSDGPVLNFVPSSRSERRNRDEGKTPQVEAANSRRMGVEKAQETVASGLRTKPLTLAAPPRP